MKNYFIVHGFVLMMSQTGRCVQKNNPVRETVSCYNYIMAKALLELHHQV